MASVPTLFLLSVLAGTVPAGNDPPPVTGGGLPSGQVGDVAPGQDGSPGTTQHPAAPGSTSLPGIPTSKALRQALVTVRAAYHDDLQAKRRKDLQALVGRLSTEASHGGGDPARTYALFVEAEDLAVKISDPLALLAAVELRCAAFSCGDLTAAKKAALARVGHPVARAMVVLIDHPQDPEANATVGRFYAFELQQWDTALPLLARSSNPLLKSIAEQELAAPSDTLQMMRLGDAWYDEAKVLPQATRDAAYVRTLMWYHRIGEGLTAAAKKREAEVAALVIQEGLTDWNALTPGQWTRLRGTTVEVDVSKHNEIPAALIPAGPYRILPDPKGTWTVIGPKGPDLVDYHGDGMNRIGGLLAGQMVMTCGSSPAAALGLVTDDTQPLVLGGAVTPASCPMPTVQAGDIKACGGGGGGHFDGFVPGSGTIRVKLVAMDDYTH